MSISRRRHERRDQRPRVQNYVLEIRDRSIEADTSDEVFISAWRRGDMRLLLSILQLDAKRGVYFAAFALTQQ